MAFESPGDPLVFSSQKVMFEGWPVLLVSHEEDGAWQFVNGWGDTEGVEEVARVHVEHVLERDPSIAPLADLPLGWRAWRIAPDAEWQRERIPLEET